MMTGLRTSDIELAGFDSLRFSSFKLCAEYGLVEHPMKLGISIALMPDQIEFNLPFHAL